jgi:hypothetical protein
MHTRGLAHFMVGDIFPLHRLGKKLLLGRLKHGLSGDPPP